MGVRTFTFLSIAAVAIITLGRYFTNRSNPLSRTGAPLANRYHTAWSGWLLILLMSLTTDINDGMGAAFSAAVLIGLLGQVLTGRSFLGLLSAGNTPATSGGASTPSGPLPRRGGTAPSKPSVPSWMHPAIPQY